MLHNFYHISYCSFMKQNSQLIVEIRSFSSDPREAPILQDLFRPTRFRRNTDDMSLKIGIPQIHDFVYSIYFHKDTCSHFYEFIFPNFMLIFYSFALSVLNIPVLSKAHPIRLKSDNFIAIFKHLLFFFSEQNGTIVCDKQYRYSNS